MQNCQNFEGQAIDYVCKLLSEPQFNAFEQHLKYCAHCREEVQVVKAVLQMTDEAQGEVNLPVFPLRDIEMNVYKRLAETSSGYPQTLGVRLRNFKQILLEQFLGSVTRWQRMAVAGSVVVVLIAITVFLNGPFRLKPALPLNVVQSADDRIEQYRQQNIQRRLEDALITHHLRNDTWETASRFQRMKEQAHGTNWVEVANTHLQRLK